MKRIHQPLLASILLTFAMASSPASGQDPPDGERRLSLPDAVALALENSPALNAERARAAGSRERQGAARADYRPQASFQANATQFEDPMIVTPIHGFAEGAVPFFDDLLIQSTLNVELLLYDGNARHAAARRARAESEAATDAVNDARSRVIADSVVAYLDLLGSRGILEAQDLRLAALRLERERMRALYAVGRIAEVEVLRLDAAVARDEAERSLRSTDVDNARQDLARLLGLGEESVSGEMLSAQALRDEDPPSREALLALAKARNRRILQAAKRLEAAEAGVAVARSVRKPKLSASANVTDFGSAELDFTTEWATGLRLSVPLYLGGRTARRIAEVGAARDEAEQELHALERRIASAVDHAHGAWLAAVERETSLEAAVRGFKAVAASEKLKLETGTGIPADFLDSEADLLEARASRVIAANAVVLSRVALAEILGELDEAWIVRHIGEVTSVHTR